MNVNKYESAVQATSDFYKKGFKKTYKLRDGELVEVKVNKKILLKDINIVEYHRFESTANPNKITIIIALEHKDKSKGLLIDDYENYIDINLMKFMTNAKIKVRETSV